MKSCIHGEDWQWRQHNVITHKSRKMHDSLTYHSLQ